MYGFLKKALMIAIVVLLVGSCKGKNSASISSSDIETKDIWNYLHKVEFNKDKPVATYDKLVNFYNTTPRNYFEGKNKIKIAYKVFPGENPEKAIVLVTGRTESSLKYAELIYNLQGLGYTIYIYDHRGQGFSDRLIHNDDVGYVEDFHNYVDDLKQFYDTYIKPNNHKELFLIGHSMGGGIATLFLQENPTIFTKAILLSPLHEINTGSIPEWAAKALGEINILIGRDEAYVPGGEGYVSDKPFIDNALTHSTIRFDFNKYVQKHFTQIRFGSASYKWLSEAITATNTMKEKAFLLKTPTLIIEAEGDVVVVNAAHKQICRQAAHCSVVSIKGAWHEAYNESDDMRDEVLKNILRFLL